ncbi:MAG: extracellular solute-binding protein [Wenzhouxiangella sp.]|nr:extracellular solute-binding protein [Wenzhouxiangella sp.]MCH8477067.1 extracellular solute-binding protein [Wenzhouxiangella sp.]TVR94216.1 MAG: extracellular solute-binding protein [Wenzhouxiangellaceae bacterium]
MPCRFLTVFALTLGMYAPSAWSDSDPLLVWSYRGGEVIEPLLEAFTEQTGLAVEYRVLGGDGIVEALIEGTEQKPDLILVVDALRVDTLQRAGLLRPLPQEALAGVDPKWRDSKDYWSGIAWRARSVVRRADSEHPADVDALTDLARNGQLCIRPGAHVYNRGWLTWLVANRGVDASLAWATTVFDHRVEVPGGDRDQIRAVANGLCTAALVNHYYLMRWAASDDPEERAIAENLVFGWPDSSTPVAVNITAIALPKGGRHPALADRLAAWLTRPEAQAMYAASVFEFPLDWPQQQTPLATGLEALDLKPGEPWPRDLPAHRDAAETFFAEPPVM